MAGLRAALGALELGASSSVLREYMDGLSVGQSGAREAGWPGVLHGFQVWLPPGLETNGSLAREMHQPFPALGILPLAPPSHFAFLCSLHVLYSEG